jgi:tRNA nucleotidyltransferase/poly(A) polymerase
VLDREGRLHEVTTFRRDVSTDGRHAEVAYGVSLAEDLARRDFTSNAIAYHPLRHEWRDPHGGAADLSSGTMRAVGDAAERFREDYLRILRGLRFASRFGFAIDERTWEGMRTASAGLAGLSAERVRDEWFKGLQTARSVAAFVRLWHDSGAASVVLPELRDVALADPDAPPRDPALLSACLVDHPVAVLVRLRASIAEVARARHLALTPPAPAGTGDADVRRWLAAVGPAADDLLRVHRIRTGAEAQWGDAVLGIRSRGEATERGALAVSGTDLLAAGLAPGPGIGRVLGQLLEEVLEAPSANTRDHLLARARELA